MVIRSVNGEIKHNVLSRKGRMVETRWPKISRTDGRKRSSEEIEGFYDDALYIYRPRFPYWELPDDFS